MSTEEQEKALFASALKFNDNNDLEILAQGEGAVAQLIEATARKHNIPVFEDFELSAELSQLPSNEQIPDELYFVMAALFDYILGVD